MGLSGTLLFTTGALSTRKWSVAPESEMAYFTALVTFVLSKRVAAIGSSCEIFACTSYFHATDLVGIEIGGEMLISLMGIMVGTLISTARRLVDVVV